MKRATRATWAKRIEEWKASGLDALAFAAKLGVTPRTLKWWTWQLGDRSRRKPKAIAPPVERGATTPPMTFVEMTAVVRGEPIEIVLRNELRVRVAPTFDEATLDRVLDVLGRR